MAEREKTEGQWDGGAWQGVLSVAAGEEAAQLAVIFFPWEGEAEPQRAVELPFTPDELALSVRPPTEALRQTLPAELGGPWRYGLGYFVLKDEAGAQRWAQSHRLLWCDAEVPEALIAMIEGSDEMAPEAAQAYAQGLRSLKPGWNVIQRSAGQEDTGGQSLLGFEATEAAIVLDDFTAWEPEVF